MARVEVAPRRAALGPRRAGRRVHPDAAHAGQVDHDAAVARAEPGHAVTAAAHGEVEPVLPREVHGRHHVAGVRRADDRGRPPVDHGVVDDPRLLVPLVVGSDHRPADQRPQIVELRCRHVSSFVRLNAVRSIADRREAACDGACEPRCVVHHLSERAPARRMVGMAIAVHLLGPPLLIRDEVVYATPRGRKVWALLAYLALSHGPAQPAAADRPAVHGRGGPGGRPALEPVGAAAAARRTGHGRERERGPAPAPRGHGDRRPRADGRHVG